MSLAYNHDLSKLPGLAHGQTYSADNPFEPFFGPVSVQDGQKVRSEDVFSHETYNLPEAYKGRNLHLGDIMDFLITRTDDWYTSRVMPWRMTDELSVEWNIFRFNKTMADLEPHQGVPRYVTAESESRSDRLVRRGLAFIIEHGFFSTERGRRHYMMNLEQITSAVHETCFFGVLHALLAGKNHYKEWQRQYGRRISRVSDLLSLERNRWAVCQKTERGLYLLDAELKDAMKYQNVVPDTWIFPSKMSIYVSMVPSSEVSYQEVGRSSAVAKNNDIAAAPQQLLTFRGCTVHETRPFDMDFSGQPTELLRREQMIGSYFTMLPHSRPAVDDGSYKTDHRSIWIYNMDVDRYEKVHIADAVENCFRFDEESGTVHHAHAGVLYEHGLPSSKDVAMRNDPLFCHNLQGGAASRSLLKQSPKPDGVCVVLGDLPLEHFKGSDLRDWVESVKNAAKKARGPTANELTWYNNLINGSGSGGAPTLGGEPIQVQPAAPGGGSSFSADPIVVDALENAWDPVLIASLHNDSMPVNAVSKSAQDLQEAYHAEFPQTWKNLLTAEDVAYARKQVVKKAKALVADPRAYAKYLSNANEHYAEHFTDRVLTNRSQFIAGGLLEQALNEMQNPSAKGKRTKAAKRIAEFIANFATTAEYFKRENPELQDDTHVLREILRSYIQPMAADDAQQLEQAIEAKVMNKETVTPDMLNALRQQLSQETSSRNLTSIAQQLQQAAADMSSYGRGQSGKDTFKAGDGSDFDTSLRGQVQGKARAPSLGDSMEYVIRTAEDVTGKPDKQLRKAFMDTKITKENLLKMAENDIIVPFGFMLTRPFQRYDMCSAILCKSGAQLGNTYMGHNDFQLTDDVIHKVHVGHYTFYSKSIVHDEKQYQIAENVFGAGYKGGENTRMYSDKAELLDDVHAEAFRASIICMLIPYRTNQGGRAPRIENPVDITGKLHPTLYAETDIPEGEIDEAQYPGARYYAEVLELKKLTAYASDATEHFMSPFKYLNTVCFQGAQFMYNDKQGAFTDKIANTGHWGNTYNGCGKIRNGQNAFLKEEAQMTPYG